MSNPVIDNIRHSLGRTECSPLDLRPIIYQSRQTGTTGSEIQLFLDELKKLSGVGQLITPNGSDEALKTLVGENNIHKATV